MMQVALGNANYLLEVKRSKFLSYLCPHSDYDAFLAELKKEHPKARHFVTARRFFNSQGHISEAFSDDGEPKGTAGMPLLSVLRGEELIDTALIVVRYFGGTKLGTGGLVRAYGEAAKCTINEARLSPYIKRLGYQLIYAYTHEPRMHYHCEKNQIMVDRRSFELDHIVLTVRLSESEFMDFKQLDAFCELKPLEA